MKSFYQRSQLFKNGKSNIYHETGSPGTPSDCNGISILLGNI